MTNDQIALVQQSFRMLISSKDAVASQFYQNLFAADPSLQALFAGADLPQQGNKLMAALGFVVGALRDPDMVCEKLRALAIRHRSYGVQERDHATVGVALMATLEVGLSQIWSSEMSAAWGAAYASVSEIMVGAAQDHRAAA